MTPSTGGHDHETPLQRAKRLRFSPQLATFSSDAQRHIRRVTDVTKLSAPMMAILDREEAPFKTCRWVAWGRRLQDRMIRLALALLLRREADVRNPGRSTTGWAWSKDHVLAAGEKLFRASPQHDRLVRAGVLAPPGTVPDLAVVRAISMEWDRVWGAVQRELATLEHHGFYEAARRLAAERKRRRARKRMHIGPKEAAVLDALDGLRRLVVRGELTVGDLEEVARDAGGDGGDGRRARRVVPSAPRQAASA